MTPTHEEQIAHIQGQINALEKVNWCNACDAKACKMAEDEASYKAITDLMKRNERKIEAYRSQLAEVTAKS